MQEESKADHESDRLAKSMFVSRFITVLQNNFLLPRYYAPRGHRHHRGYLKLKTSHLLKTI